MACWDDSAAAMLETQSGWISRRPHAGACTPKRSTNSLMIMCTDASEETGRAGSARLDRGATRMGSFRLLILSAWCGLVAGLLEVGAIILRKRTLDFNQLYWTSRHFIWLIPLIDLAIFLALGV